jgi:hypothetical protein
MQMTQTTTHDSARPTRIARLTTVDDDKFFDLGLQAAECRLAAERPDLGFRRRQVLLARAEFYLDEQLRMSVARLDAEGAEGAEGVGAEQGLTESTITASTAATSPAGLSSRIKRALQ